MKNSLWKDPVRLFLFSAGGLLLLTAAAKIGSSFGRAPILDLPDPILAFPFRYVFVIVGCIEIVVAGLCLFGRPAVLRVGSVLALASCFVIYRLGLMCIGYHRPCRCLGTLTDMLKISDETADLSMKVVAAYLWLGSMICFLWIWWQKQRLQRSSGRTDEIASAISERAL